MISGQFFNDNSTTRMQRSSNGNSSKHTGEVIGALCKVKGPAVFLICRDAILKSVSDNLERKLPQDCAEFAEMEALMHKLGAAVCLQQPIVSFAEAQGN